MNKKSATYIILITCLTFSFPLQSVRGRDDSSLEYEVKAGFLYNFLKFVEWPEEKVGDSNEPIIIAVIGKDVFKDAFDNIKDKTIEGRKITVKHFKGISELQRNSSDEPSVKHPQIEAIQQSHLIFICPSEKNNIEEILRLLKDQAVLTVADTEGFLDAGGIIKLLMEENKVRFEINMIAAKEAKIKIRSQLLRLAKKVMNQQTSYIETNLFYIAHQAASYKKFSEETHTFS